jgi:hypothetical protein
MVTITTLKASTVKNTVEKEQFWKEHTRIQKESGLSKIAYCRQHELNYARFCYWLRKWKSTPPKLVPIKLKSDEKQFPANALTTPLLCTLALKNGNVLKIHDKEVLPLILSILN